MQAQAGLGCGIMTAPDLANATHAPCQADSLKSIMQTKCATGSRAGLMNTAGPAAAVSLQRLPHQSF